MGLLFKQSPLFRQLADSLLAERSLVFCYGLAALLAITFLAQLFPMSFFTGNSAFFEQIDASQHVAGWLFYVRDTWHFPLLHTVRLNHPDGVSIAFTDSIPLAALPFKLAARWLPSSFHYIGWWHAVAFITQAIAASFLIRAFDLRHALATVCAVFFALTWPALLWRMGHTSLLSQGILLCALALYFLGRHGNWTSNKVAACFIGLCLIGLLVHPYFLAFCYALFLAFLTDQAIAGEGWRRQFPRLLSSVVAICAAGIALGYFSHGGTTTFGYGYYSMNLTSPFCGGRLIACAPEALHHEFSEYRFADATGGQYEGYNYFGAGVLLLVSIAMVMQWRTLTMLPRRYPALALTLMLFAIYAMSNQVYFGAREVFSFPLPTFLDRLTGTFRAGGRFFWVIGYLVLFTTLATLLKRRSPVVVLLLVLAMLLQWLDVQPLRERIANKAATQATHDLAPWTAAMSNVEKINIFPAFGCGESDVNMYWFFQRLAAHYGKLLDTGYIARPHVDCAINARGFAGNFLAGHLYVMSVDYLKNPFTVPEGFRTAAKRGECVKWQASVLCQTGANNAYWAGVGLATIPIAPFNDHVEWPAQALQTQTGKLQDGRLLPATTDKPGVLSFGPYIVLPAGRYHYTINFASRSDPSQTVGRWDVVLSSANGAGSEIAAGPLYGTGGSNARIEGTFTTNGTHLPLEIRTFFSGNGDLQLVGIALKKLSQ